MTPVEDVVEITPEDSEKYTYTAMIPSKEGHYYVAISATDYDEAVSIMQELIREERFPEATGRAIPLSVIDSKHRLVLKPTPQMDFDQTGIAIRHVRHQL